MNVCWPAKQDTGAFLYKRNTEDEVLISSFQVTMNVCWPARQDTGAFLYKRNTEDKVLISSFQVTMNVCWPGRQDTGAFLYKRNTEEEVLPYIIQIIADMWDRTPVRLFIRERLKTRYFFHISCNECLLIFGAGHRCDHLLRVILDVSPPSCMSQNICSDLIFIVVSMCPSYQESRSSSFKFLQSIFCPLWFSVLNLLVRGIEIDAFCKHFGQDTLIWLHLRRPYLLRRFLRESAT